MTNNLEEDNRDENSSGRVQTFNLNSPWAWLYYSTFGMQLIVVSVILIYRQTAIVDSDPITDTYLAVLKEVSPHVPAATAYSMTLAVIVEGMRMIADSVLEKRFRRGRAKGRQEGREEGREEGRQEGRQQGREDARKEWATLIGQSPTVQAAIQKAIESGEIELPPFMKNMDDLNGGRRD